MVTLLACWSLGTRSLKYPGNNRANQPMGFFAHPLAEVERKRETEDGKEKNRDHMRWARMLVPGLPRLVGAGSR